MLFINSKFFSGLLAMSEIASPEIQRKEKISNFLPLYSVTTF